MIQFNDLKRPSKLYLTLLLAAVWAPGDRAADDFAGGTQKMPRNLSI